MSAVGSPTPPAVRRATWRGHLAILRVDHWFKNVFVLPGIVVALSVVDAVDVRAIGLRLFLGLLALCLVASSNYVINELLDAPFDRHHPTKQHRPVPAGLVHPRLAVLQWLAVMVLGLAVSFAVNTPFTATLVALWLMGCAYNIRPLRTKDLPYLDVLSESVNNPIRMLAGWFIVDPPAFPPASLLVSYWMIGAYFMAMKRYAEFRSIGDREVAAAYRSSFRFYSEERLLTSITFYASASMLFFGAFIMRYRLELVLAFPFLAWVMASYMDVGLKNESAAQRPEALYREPSLMVAVVTCAAVLIGLLFIDLPMLDRWFAPLMPQR